MKIKRIILVTLIVLSYFFIQDLRYFGPARRLKNSPSVNFSVGGLPDFRQEIKHVNLKKEITFEEKVILNGVFGQTEVKQIDGNELRLAYAIRASSKNNLENYKVIEKYTKNELIYELEGLESTQDAAIDFFLEVPRGIEVVINQSFGDLEVLDFEGDLKINASHADIIIERLKGSLVLNNSFGGANLKRIEGPVTINDSYSDTYLDLVRVQAGYDFDVDLSFGELKKYPPFSTKSTQSKTTGSGQTGEGKYPVIINSSFGTLEIRLDY